MNILIVDDALFLRTALKHILEKNGFDVIGEAIDGNDAVEKYKTLKPDVVTMDITMPGLNGIDAMKKIMQYDSKAKVVMCSAMGRTDFIKEALQHGAKDFITKPFQEQVIVEILSKV